MRALFLDCISGISGDMMVGALVDLGVKPSTLEWELSKLALGDFHLHFDREKRQEIEGVKFTIHEGAVHTADQDEHDHEHGAGDHVHHHGDEGDTHSHGHSHEHEHEHGEHAHGHAHDHEHGCCDHDH